MSFSSSNVNLKKILLVFKRQKLYLVFDLLTNSCPAPPQSLGYSSSFTKSRRASKAWRVLSSSTPTCAPGNGAILPSVRASQNRVSESRLSRGGKIVQAKDSCQGCHGWRIYMEATFGRVLYERHIYDITVENWETELYWVKMKRKGCKQKFRRQEEQVLVTS